MNTTCVVSTFENVLHRIRRRFLRQLLSFACIAPACLHLWCLHLGCKETPPEPPKAATISLTAEDASCTEAWLRIKSLHVTATVRLMRDGQMRADLRLTSSDTLVVDEGLLPNRTYTYKAQLLEPQSANLIPSTPDVQLTTMDTTSHNFTWQIDTLGDGSSSVLSDVAIINDTLAYAVGEMYLRDSSGQIDPQAWNAAKWNGQRWELKRIPFVGPCSAVLYPPLKAIWAFSASSILVTNGGSIVRYDGANATMDCGMNPLLAGAINKIYAASTQDVYLVGNGGTIVHYDGTRWRRVESGTGLPIMDVDGARESQDGRYEVLCVAADPAPWGRSPILAIENSRVREVAILPWEQWCIWFVPRRYYIVGGGDGPFQAHSLDGPWLRIGELPALFQTSIDGQGFNDIVVCGAFWLLAHYNGMGWHTYFPRTGGSFGSVAIKENLTIAVGDIGDRAVAVQANDKSSYAWHL